MCRDVLRKDAHCAMPAELFLVRHASPDWNRTDLRYDIPPGPPLSEQGRAEAKALGQFLAQQGVQRIFASPMDRAHDTAAVASAASQAPVIVAEAITEWERGETESAVLARMLRQWAEAATLNAQDGGPLALITHGGPIRLLLAHLGVDSAEIDFYRRQFDRDNPVPPAGAWRLTQSPVDGAWSANLDFAPAPFHVFAPAPIVV